MDVLEYYDAAIDWTRFQQGPISDDVWRAFRVAVRLCHAFQHWKQEAERARSSSAKPVLSGTPYQRRRQHEEWRSNLRTIENRMYRAAFLAAGKLNEIAQIVQARKETSDWHFSLALVLTVGREVILDPVRGHERADFDALAFYEFDAHAEVSNDPPAMASKWRTAADKSLR